MPDPTSQDAPENQERLDKKQPTGRNSENEEKPLSPREQMLVEIEEKYEVRLEQEVKATEGEGLQTGISAEGGTVAPMHDADEDPEETASKLEVTPKPVIPEAVKLEDFVTKLEDGTPVLKMLVDGEEQLVALKDVQESQQKNVAVESRFRENSDWSDKLSIREKELDEREQNLVSESKSSPLPSGVGDQGTQERDLEEAQTIVDGLLHGDPDDAVEALATVISASKASSQTGTNTDEIVDATVKKVRADQAEDDRKSLLVEGLKTFKSEYPEIVEDPDLYALVDSKTNRIAQDNPEWNPTEVMREAGKQVQEKFGAVKPDADLVDADLTNDRQARKDTLVPIPTKRSHVSDKPEEEKPETPADIMDGIRRGRGQQ